jgi:aspartyl-tRNA(Asn)/glutamyl-tRNA(Gln) amidotransferase subunit C
VYDYARFFPAFCALRRYRSQRTTLSQITRTARMSLDLKDVASIAHLARLHVAESDLPVYASSLSKIIDMVEQLKATDTSKVEPMAHPLAGQVQRLRADVVTETDQHEKFQRNAPKTEAGLYLVPKVIE